MTLQNAFGNLALEATAAATKTALQSVITSTPGFEKVQVGTVQGRIATNFPGPSMPQGGFAVVATGSGHTVSVGGVLNGSRHLDISTGTTINTVTIVESDELVTLPVRLNVQASLSQRIVNQEFYLELAGVDGAGVVQEDATGPLDWLAIKWDSTTANNAVIMTRHGGQSVSLSSAAAFGTTAATGTTPNFIAAFTYDMLAYAERVIVSGFAVDALTAPGATLARTTNLPNPLIRYRVRFRAKNLGSAPASSTDFRIHQVRVIDQARMTAEITGGVGRAADLQSSVPINGTVTLSGAVDTELSAAAALADGLANPTTAPVGAELLGFNGTTWDRFRNNANITVDASAAKTVTVAGATAVNFNATGMVAFLNVTAASGTTPTLVAKLQMSPDGTNWVDIPGAATTTITATGLTSLTLYPGIPAVANASIPLPVPRTWRWYFTIGGSTPSFTLTTVAAYIL